jgi:hypothetical protein
MIFLTPADGLPTLTVEFGEPPTGAEADAVRARQERARRNSQWLQTHWDELLPQAVGKFVAVAGEEAFVAETAQQAWAWAAEKHPEDDTATVQYVSPRQGLKVYANRR